MASPFRALLDFFNIGTSSSKGGKKGLEPVLRDRKGKEDRPFDKDSKSGLSRFFQWYLTECHDTAETLKNRMDRYDDLDFMFFNDTTISMASELYADEATQADSQSAIIGVNADRSTTKIILSLLEELGYNQTVLRQIAHNLALYGDSMMVNDLVETDGLISTTPIDVRAVVERIEFNAVEAMKKMSQGRYKGLASTDDRLMNLAKAIDEQKGIKSAAFRSFLFGWQLQGNIWLPPWSISHFRLFTSRSEFFPYGKSLFIGCVGPFRQLKAAKTLMAMSRMAKLPIEVFKVTVDENMTEMDRWAAVNEARQEYENQGLELSDKDAPGVGKKLWLAEGLLEYEQISPEISLDDIGDIELLRDDVIIGTRVPKGYLIVDKSSFGTSGQALLQQFKPFGRATFSIQSAILSELTNQIRLHGLMSGKIKPETKFELTMNFPVIEESSDRLSLKKDTLGLAGDIISAVKDALGVQEGLPVDVVKDIFSRFTFLSAKEIDDWFDETLKAAAEASKADGTPEEEPQEESKRSLFSRRVSEKTRGKIEERLSNDLIMESYLTSKESRGMMEGAMGGRHFFHSSGLLPSQKAVLCTLDDDYSTLRTGKKPSQKPASDAPKMKG